MRLPSHVFRSQRGVYYFRLAIPKILRQEIGVSEIRRSLHTHDPALAKLRAFQLYCDIAPVLFEHRGGVVDSKKINELRRRGLSTSSFGGSFELDINPRGIHVKTDSSKPEDGEQAIRAIELFKGLHPEFFQNDQTQTTKNAGVKLPQHKAANIKKAAADYLKLNEEKWSAKTRVEYEGILGRFSEQMERHAVGQVSQQDINAYLLKLATEGVGIQARSKHVGALRGFFEYALSAGLYPHGIPLPTEGQKSLKKRDRQRISLRQGWKMFEPEDLKKLFDSGNYQKLTKPHEFWLPLLGLFTGARIEELCQLTVSDIQQKEDVSVIKIDVDDGDKHGRKKRLKTGSAMRLVPIHPELVKAGFLNYVVDVKSRYGIDSRIFPYLRERNVNGLSDVPSEAFSRYRKKVGVDADKKVFHSFRKTVNDRLKQAGVSEEVRCQLIGHEYDSVNSSVYSQNLNIHFLDAILFSKLIFPEVDFSMVRYDSSSLMRALDAEMARRARHNRHKVARVK